MRTKSFTVLLSLLFIALIGCGGSGGGGDTTALSVESEASKKTFRSKDPQAYETGYEMYSDISGYDSQGGRYRGSFRMVTLEEAEIDGVPAIPIETTVEISNTTNGKSNSSTAIMYMDKETSHVIKMVEEDTGRTAVAASQSDMPDTVVLGDSGVTETMLYDDGSTYSGTWHVENVIDDTAEIVTMTTMADEYENVLFTCEMTMTVDEEGIPEHIGYKYLYPSDQVTVSLSGDVTVTAFNTESP